MKPDETFKMKILLCKLGRKLGFEVDVEEPPETELGRLAIRHDVLWYIKPPKWIRELFGIMLSRGDLCREYRTLVEKKQALRRELFALENPGHLSRRFSGTTTARGSTKLGSPSPFQESKEKS